MKQETNGHSIHTGFVLIVFCVFTISVLLVLMLGVQVYQRNMEQSDANFAQRTALSYVAQKVRENDGINQVTVGQFQGQSALFLYEQEGEIVYQTVIYVYDQWLRELYCERDLELEAADGVEVLQLEQLQFTMVESDLIKIELTNQQGDDSVLYLNLQQGKQVAL